MESLKAGLCPGPVSMSTLSYSEKHLEMLVSVSSMSLWGEVGEDKGKKEDEEGNHTVLILMLLSEM